MSAKSNFHFHKNHKYQPQYKRSLHLEALEERALLSVSSWNTDAGDILYDVSDSADSGAVISPQILSNDYDVDLSDAVSAGVPKLVTKYITPEGYNDNDYQKIVAFLDQADSNGVSNGSKCTFRYDPFYLSTFYGITWNYHNGENRITQIMLPGGIDLVGSADFSGMTYLDYLSLTGSNVRSLDVSNCTYLRALYCGGNQLINLNLTGCITLKSLSCGGNLLTTLDLSSCIELQGLGCASNHLTRLNVANHRDLGYLDCSNNHIKEFNASGCPLLHTAGGNFLFENNPFEVVDLSGCTSLENFTFVGSSDSRTPLKELDVSGCTNLHYIICCYGQMTSLNVSGCTSIYHLDCSYNKFTYLDLRNSTMDCLTIAGNPLLTHVYLTKNHYYIDIYLDEYDNNDVYPDDDEWTIYAPNETRTGVNSYSPTELPFYAINSIGTQTIVFGSLFTPTLDLNYTDQNTVSVTVNGVSNASGYELQYSTSSNFSTGTVTTNVSAGTRTVSGLKANTKYYFRVKALGSGNYSDSIYSTVKSITTSSTGTKLSTPSLSLAVTGSDSISVTVGSVSNASGYRLQYSTSSSFSTGVTTQIVSAGTRTIENLSASTKYYFRVQALGSGNYSNSDYCTTKSATTNAASVSSDVSRLKSFLEQTDSNGVKNGTKINSSYNANDTSTWTGVTWSEVNGVKQVTGINWAGKSLEGGLNLSGCTALTYVDVGHVYTDKLYSNCLTSLNLTGCTALTTLNCEDNLLTSLDVSKNTALTWLKCGNNDNSHNKITTLNVSQNTALTYLNCMNISTLKSLDVSKNTALTTLDVNFLELYSIDVSNNTKLITLNCRRTRISSLDVSRNTALEKLDCGWNNLTSLDVSKNTKLKRLHCYSNQLTELDVSKNTELSILSCYKNQLTSLNLSKNTKLQQLHCYNNQLTSLDMSKNTQLKELSCSYNQLTSINLLNATLLEKLWCYDNRLAAINVSKNTALTFLNLGVNHLTSLDVSNNTELVDLDCSSNQLTSLDVSKNFALEVLWCWNSNLNNVVLPSERLTDLDVGLSWQSGTEWTYQDAIGNGLAIDTLSYDNVKCKCGVIATTTVLPVTATNEAGTQTITFTGKASIAKLTTPTLSVSATGSNSVSVTVGSVTNASGYTLQYSTNATFPTTGTTTLNVSAGTRAIGGLTANTTYCFRVMAVGSGSYSNSDYSEAKSATTFANTITDNVGDSLSTAKEITFTNNTFSFTDKLGEGNYGQKDVDIYKLVVSSADAGREYTFKTSQPSGGTKVDTYIRLFNASGTQLACDDDSGNNGYSSLTWTLFSAGTYYLGVSSYANRSYNATTAGSASNGDQGDYTLTVTRNGLKVKLSDPTLSVVTTGTDTAAVTVGGVANASGYTLQYSKNPDFSNAANRNVPAGTTTINNLSPDTMYYFRVMATGTGAYSNSDFSSIRSAKTDKPDDTEITINGKKVTISWEDGSPMPDAVRYRVANGSTKWTTKKLKAGVTSYTFSGAVGKDYEIQVLLDQQETNILQATAVVLDQPKLKADKAYLKDDTFQVNVTNYAAKNLAANATQAILTVNGVQTKVDIQYQQGSAALANGGYVTFNNGLFTFTDMNSNTAYKVQVAFTDGLSVSTLSSNLSVKTTKACYETPTLTSATAISDTAISVTWTSVNGKNSPTRAQTYTIQYSLNGKKWTNATTKATGNSYTIQKLKGGNEYRIRVLATKDKQFEASAVSNDLPAETLALPKTALDKKTMTSSSFKLNVTNYYGTNLTKATTLNVLSDKYGTTSINLQNGGSASFAYGMTVTFSNGALTFTNVPVGIQQKLQINVSNGVCTTAWSKAVSVKTK